MDNRKCALTLEETCRLLGIKPKMAGWCRNKANEILSDTTGEPAWDYARVSVRERESGVPELVISVPFEIKGL